MSIIPGIPTPTLNPNPSLNPHTQRHHNLTFTLSLTIPKASLWGNVGLFKFL